MIKTCQSCGMPLTNEEDRGTEKDGSISADYCKYCYANGEFTDPSITIDQMAERCGGIMSQMYGLPAEKSVEFSRQQLSSLKRWSGKVFPMCESCGMPMIKDEDLGTEADGKKSQKYCQYCYQNGAFTQPELTLDSAVTAYAPMMAENLGISIKQAEVMVRAYLSGLERWQE